MIENGLRLFEFRPLRFKEQCRAAKEAGLVQPAPPEGASKKSITTEQLADVLFARFPDIEDGKAFRRALSVFDADGNGWIDFDEFVLALMRLEDGADDVEKKLAFVFDLFDESRDGELELWEISDAIEDHRKDIEDMYQSFAARDRSPATRGDAAAATRIFLGCFTATPPAATRIVLRRVVATPRPRRE